MKKIIMAVVLTALTLGNVAFAGEKEIEKRVQVAFQKEFVGAADIQWHKYDSYVQVDFTFNSMHLSAYYNNAGESLGLVRHIRFSMLPLALQFDLHKNYKGYWISEIYELANKAGTTYHLTIENADKSIQLRSDGSGDWEVTKKEVK